MSIEQQLDDINTNLRRIAELLTPTDKKVAPAPKAVEIRKPPMPAATPVEEKLEEIGLEEVQKATTALLTKRGHATTVKLLASFKAAKATEIEPSDRAEFLADAKTLMAAA